MWEAIQKSAKSRVGGKRVEDLAQVIVRKNPLTQTLLSLSPI